MGGGGNGSVYSPLGGTSQSLRAALQTIIELGAAGRAEAEELEPVFADFVAAILGDVSHEGFEFVTGKVFDTSTLLAEKEVVVAGNLGDKSLTAVGVMNPLNGPQFFELFEGAVNGDETQAGAPPAREVVNVRGAKRPVAGGDGFNDGAARSGQTIAVPLEEGEPGLDAVGSWGESLHA